MSDAIAEFVPADPDNESRNGLFSHFEPGTRVLPAGFQISPFMPLSIDIVFEKDVAVLCAMV